VIQMFKLARDNWGDDHKEVTYTSDDGTKQDLVITGESLQDIDFDTDIDFNLDSVSVNQDILSQRWISLLDTSLQVPEADVGKVYQKVLRESFKIPNPDYYAKQVPEIDPLTGQPMPPEGMPPANPESVPEEQSLGSQLAPQPGYAPMGT